MPRKTLEAAETALDGLANRLDVPIAETGPCTVVLGIARQTALVYQGLRREAGADGTGIVGQILLRPIIEAAILVRWIEDSPHLRVEMYHADDQRRRLSSADTFTKWRKSRGISTDPAFPGDEMAAMRANVDAVRARALTAGEPIKTNGPILPSLEIMANRTADSGALEAYQILYRVVSPFTHVSGMAIASHRLERHSDGIHLVVDGPYGGATLRALAAPSMAHLIGSTSRICRLGLEGEARIWQDAVIEGADI